MDSGGTPTRASQFDVVFVLPHMGLGGAQRVVSLVANAWAREGRRVCVLTWIDGREEAHALDPAVARVSLSQYMIARDARLPRWSWRRARLRLREVERALRPRWPWRKAHRGPAEAENGETSLEGPTELDISRSSWRLRKALARLLLALDRSLRQLRLQQAHHPSAARKSLRAEIAESLVRHRVSLLGMLPKLVLDRRVDAFRSAFIEFGAPVVVSLLTRTNIYVLAATRGLPLRVVISERNDPDLQLIDPLLDGLRSISYRRAHAVTANSATVLAKMERFVPAKKLRLLPNPVVPPPIPARAEARGQHFVTLGRLVKQKGTDVLLHAFARIADELPDWSLEIIGDGPLRAELAALAERLGLGRRVTFRGYVDDPVDELMRAQVFVLPSRFEGMPNALLEAMACGLAPVVTDASPGPLECVRHEETGLVVPAENPEALAAAMQRLAVDDDLRERLAIQAAECVRAHVWPAVESQWLEVLGMAEAAEQGSPAGTRIDAR